LLQQRPNPSLRKPCREEASSSCRVSVLVSSAPVRCQLGIVVPAASQSPGGHHCSSAAHLPPVRKPLVDPFLFLSGLCVLCSLHSLISSWCICLLARKSAPACRRCMLFCTPAIHLRAQASLPADAQARLMPLSSPRLLYNLQGFCSKFTKCIYMQCRP